MNSSFEALKARVDFLGDLNAADLNAARLAETLAHWVRHSLGCDAHVELTEFDEENGSAPRVVDRSTPIAVDSPSNWRFPLVHRGRRLGRLCVSPPAGDAPAVCPTVIQELAQEFSRLLDQARRFEEAREEALRDELTGLGNRRLFERSLRTHIESARERRFPFSVLLFDVDHFKRFNDAWGHETGDRVLRLVADLMKRVFRADDVVCRIGGEEFAVLLCDRRSPDTDAAPPREARIVTERLQREAERLAESMADGALLAKISLSGGVATFPWDAQSPGDLLREADNALYAAKRAGRNRIFFASDDAEMIATLAG